MKGLSNFYRESSRRLKRNFFDRPTLQVARELLGKFIVRSYRRRVIAGMITETEAYKGPKDRASHTFGGRRTAAVEAMYGEGGVVYVYLVYGMHWQLNFSTAGKEKPEAVLIRGVLPETKSQRRITDGPGKVSKYLKINRALYGEDVTSSKNIWLEDRGVVIPSSQIKKGPRIGIHYAGPYWAAKPWRFWVELTSSR